MRRLSVSLLALVVAIVAVASSAFARTPAAAQTQAAGRPICPDPGLVTQLQSGLPAMDEAIRRTEAQLDAARQASINADAAARERAIDAAKSEVQSAIGDFVGNALTLRRRVEALRRAGLARGARRELLEQAKDAQEILEQLQKMQSYWSDAQQLIAVGGAGYQTGVELRTAARSFAQDVTRINELFVNTGIWDALGENLSGSFGPFGSLAFRAARAAMDIGFSVAESALSESEYLTASRHLDVMRAQRSRIESRIFDMQQVMANCAPMPQTSSSPTSPQAGGQTSGGGAASAVILSVAGAAAAGLGTWYVLQAVDEYTSSTSSTTSTPTRTTTTTPTTPPVTPPPAAPSYDGIWNVTVLIDGCYRITHTVSMQVVGGAFSSSLFTYCANARNGATRVDTGGGCGSDGSERVSITGTMSNGRVNGNQTLTGSFCNGTNGFTGFMNSTMSGDAASGWGQLTFRKR